ncbi:hypothetical protein [Streptomyces tsukubensis]|uniref:DUF3558 domain-containing protein n=1 Tax=Streptomyces tsukubensis TaxID=83656 RepID=A0A1V4A7B0_9ACTN|nr:hypothetical protein [Streptomyces tsukubensis]OON78359.1 hypothetical protein B1H18_16310 [Streptomyces tsukubensis]QFR95119.1 DUF3558 domain-containing protein [Streptomyces tsukubensis]
MDRKAYVPGIAALLAALLTGCTGGTGGDGSTDDPKSGGAESATATAPPGKYRTLPEPCREVSHETLDGLLPGLRKLDKDQRDKAYDGTSTLTFDTDRRVGCRWKAETPDASNRLTFDFERVVSYDGVVSDDSSANSVYDKKAVAAGLPPSTSESDAPPSGSSTSTGPDSKEDTPEGGDPKEGASKENESRESGSKANNSAKGEQKAADGTDRSDRADGANEPKTLNHLKRSGSDTTPSPDGSRKTDGDTDTPEGDPATSTANGTPNADNSPESPADLRPRTLGDLGNAAFLDDQLTGASSTAQRRTVTVVFRTSNVIVTIAYDEQRTHGGEVPDSKEMQDRTEELARSIAEKFDA